MIHFSAICFALSSTISKYLIISGHFMPYYAAIICCKKFLCKSVPFNNSGTSATRSIPMSFLNDYYNRSFLNETYRLCFRPSDSLPTTRVADFQRPSSPSGSSFPFIITSRANYNVLLTAYTSSIFYSSHSSALNRTNFSIMSQKSSSAFLPSVSKNCS